MAFVACLAAVLPRLLQEKLQKAPLLQVLLPRAVLVGANDSLLEASVPEGDRKLPSRAVT